MSVHLYAKEKLNQLKYIILPNYKSEIHLKYRLQTEDAGLNIYIYTKTWIPSSD